MRTWCGIASVWMIVVAAPAFANLSCPSGNQCLVEMCAEGACKIVDEVQCAVPDDPCMQSECDPSTGLCVEVPVVCSPCESCSDGDCVPNPASVGSPCGMVGLLSCMGMQCGATGVCDTPVPLDGGVCFTDAVGQCTSGVGSCSAGVCVTPVFDGFPCGGPCSPGTCVGGACSPGPPAANGTPCDPQVVNMMFGEQGPVADAQVNGCLPTGECQSGVCEVTDVPTCAECGNQVCASISNPDLCVEGRCVDSNLGFQCVGDPTSGNSCNDFNDCTAADRCDQGVCTGTSVSAAESQAPVVSPLQLGILVASLVVAGAIRLRRRRA